MPVLHWLGPNVSFLKCFSEWYMKSNELDPHTLLKMHTILSSLSFQCSPAGMVRYSSSGSLFHKLLFPVSELDKSMFLSSCLSYSAVWRTGYMGDAWPCLILIIMNSASALEESVKKKRRKFLPCSLKGKQEGISLLKVQWDFFLMLWYSVITAVISVEGMHFLI